MLAGLGLSRIVSPVTFWWFVISLVFVVLAWKKKGPLLLVGIVLTGLFAGISRGHSYAKQLQPYRDLTGKSVRFVAKVQSDATYDDQGQLTFDAGSIHFIAPKSQTVPGRISVSGYGEAAIYRGDVIEVTGLLRPTRGSRQARVSFSSFSVTIRNQTFVEHIRRQFVAGVGNALPEPSSSFGLGLLIGYRTSLPEITQEQLKITGLTHIIAVSGYNLTIIVQAVRRGLANRSKYQQVVICVGLILLFLLITDFSASIVRASIVSILSLLAWYYGRQFKPLLLLVLAAALTAFWSPLYIWSDIGWYLSFLAFFGILVVAPLVSTFIRQKNGNTSLVGQLVVETTAAQLMVAPLILMIFSRISLIALVSNLIIAPLVPFAMLMTMVAGVFGVMFPVLAGFIGWPARMLLRYMLDMVQLLSNVPHAMIERPISVPSMVACYVCIGLVVIGLQRRQKTRYGTITDKNSSA